MRVPRFVTLVLAPIALIAAGCGIPILGGSGGSNSSGSTPRKVAGKMSVNWGPETGDVESSEIQMINWGGIRDTPFTPQSNQWSVPYGDTSTSTVGMTARLGGAHSGIANVSADAVDKTLTPEVAAPADDAGQLFYSTTFTADLRPNSTLELRLKPEGVESGSNPGQNPIVLLRMHGGRGGNAEVEMGLDASADGTAAAQVMDVDAVSTQPNSGEFVVTGTRTENKTIINVTGPNGRTVSGTFRGVKASAWFEVSLQGPADQSVELHTFAFGKMGNCVELPADAVVGTDAVRAFRTPADCSTLAPS